MIIDHKYWEFSIRVMVDEITDFNWKLMFDEVKECAEKNLSRTMWKYETTATPHYPTEYKTIHCDDCNDTTSHVSIDGNDFVCLVCKDRDKSVNVK